MATSAKKQTLKQIQADAERLTQRRLEDDGFESHYPNGYMTDSAPTEEVEDLSPLEKARAAKAKKAEAAKAQLNHEKTNESEKEEDQ